MATTTTKRYFFKDADTLAHLFTSPAYWDQEKQGKYMDSGMKPIEEFENDICMNLVEWGCDKDSIYYRTKKYWYQYTLDYIGTAPIIKCARFDIGAWTRLDTWMNKHSTGVGKEWLLKTEQKIKYVPLYNVVRK